MSDRVYTITTPSLEMQMERYPMTEKTNRTRPDGRILALASLTAGALLAGLVFLLVPWQDRPAAESLAEDLPEQPATPPIDAATSKDIETATFALG
jgi:hypothetical protein